MRPCVGVKQFILHKYSANNSTHSKKKIPSHTPLSFVFPKCETLSTSEMSYYSPTSCPTTIQPLLLATLRMHLVQTRDSTLILGRSSLSLPRWLQDKGHIEMKINENTPTRSTSSKKKLPPLPLFSPFFLSYLRVDNSNRLCTWSHVLHTHAPQIYPKKKHKSHVKLQVSNSHPRYSSPPVT